MMMSSHSRRFGLGRVRTFVFCLAVLGIVLGASVKNASATFVGDLVTVEFWNEANEKVGYARIANSSDSDLDRDRVQRDEKDIAEGAWFHDGSVINSLNVNLDGDPMVELDFDITAGSSAVTVVITSATVSFAAINNPEAFADATGTLQAIVDPGASLSVVGGNIGLFQAIYNPANTEYADLIGDFASPNLLLASFDAEDVTDSIAGPVTEIKATWAFKLSANDHATGHGIFVITDPFIIPEPSSFALAGMGLLGLARVARRRRKA